MSNRLRPPCQSGEPCLGSAPARVLVGAILVVVSAIPACDSHNQPEPRLICLTHIGDDGLTSRMTEALEARIGDKREWVLGGCSTDDSLFVCMRAPEWNTVDSRIEVRPTLAVRNGRFAQPVTIDSRCWDDDLSLC